MEYLHFEDCKWKWIPLVYVWVLRPVNRVNRASLPAYAPGCWQTPWQTILSANSKSEFRFTHLSDFVPRPLQSVEALIPAETAASICQISNIAFVLWIYLDSFFRCLKHGFAVFSCFFKTWRILASTRHVLLAGHLCDCQMWHSLRRYHEKCVG
jgi:hypothetical protein